MRFLCGVATIHFACKLPNKKIFNIQNQIQLTYCRFYNNRPSRSYLVTYLNTCLLILKDVFELCYKVVEIMSSVFFLPNAS